MHLPCLRASLLSLTLPLATFACQMPNPAFDDGETGSESTGKDTLAGDGDGDPEPGDGDGEPGDGDGEPGDGDGEPGDGDGDGEPGDGDGDGEPIMCTETEMLCDGICTKIEIDPFNCGGCGHECSDGQLCSIGTCGPKRYVFATQATFTGLLGGIAGAENICNEVAVDANLPGNYRPWLSDNLLFPAAAVNAGPVVYVLRGGTVVAYSQAQLFSGQLMHEIDQTEYGEAITPTPACDGAVQYGVWTGTNAMGVPAAPFCNGWTYGGDVGMGRVGDATATNMNWAATDCQELCNVPLRLYCIGY